MRSFVVMAMLVASLSHAAWNGYTEDRDLELDTKGINAFEIDAGAGSLVITGGADVQKIHVKATINVPDESAQKAQEMISSDLKLSLDKVRDRARLEAHFDSRSWGWNDSPTVDLEIQVPHGLPLEIDDGSGSLQVTNVASSVVIDDGSGGISVDDVEHDLTIIDDGSGAMNATNVRGTIWQDT